jgi:DNA-3-methyladenine glycosylase I
MVDHSANVKKIARGGEPRVAPRVDHPANVKKSARGGEPRGARQVDPKKPRCRWAQNGDTAYLHYHDEEWGRPSHDDVHLFEMLILEGAQAGLSWSTILHKRANYRRAFAQFDPRKVARFDARRRAALLRDEGIVRNRLKIESTVTNARAFLEVQREFGSFDRYLWGFVGGRPVVKATGGSVPASTPLSDRLSKDLKERGFRFVGSTIVYAFLQAVGVVNDHSPTCFLGVPSRRRAPPLR